MIVVTPEYVAPMTNGQMLPGGPGTFTDLPTDRELFFHHLLEVPKFGDECSDCMNGAGGACPIHAPGGGHVVTGTSGPDSPLIRPEPGANYNSAPPAATDVAAPISRSRILPERTKAASGASASRADSPKFR